MSPVASTHESSARSSVAADDLEKQEDVRGHAEVQRRERQGACRPASDAQEAEVDATGLAGAEMGLKRSLMSRIRSLELQVEKMERKLRENERHMKEFVIDKVLDLEDELRELQHQLQAASPFAPPSGPDACSSSPSEETPALVAAERFEGREEITVESATLEDTEARDGRQTSEEPQTIDTPCSVSTVCPETHSGHKREGATRRAAPV
ncbi:hypothetical protein BESB_026910 [Besnoitia besnoiti]|uniref:Uncharacterized protein n=1 Tax=Besnoitia besnoiti TaxID=94643 RepID=A0A2A9M7T9_BESBE|nr:uncharacterized protein BESB_026910 [Besnoitia besnoiti]PFH31717.1 hypothetical protein BESB_026910 [Besnoitia besnoiti]